MSCIIGNTQSIKTTFKVRESGALVDPSTVTIEIHKEGATAGSPVNMTRLSLGVFQYLWDTSALTAGNYIATIEGIGGGVESREQRRLLLLEPLV